MLKLQVLGVIRHIISGLGAAVIANGYTDGAGWELFTGGVIAAIGIIWSVLEKKEV